MKKWACVVALSLSMGACGGSAPDSTAAGEGTPEAAGSAAASSASSAPREMEVTIPAGTALRLELKTAVASDTSTVEQPVSASLAEAVTIDGKVALPVGSELAGVVTEVEKSGRVRGRAHVAYRFDSVRAGGERYDVKTAPISHTAAATKGEDATKIAIGAGAGAALGAVLGGGDGAAKGAAIGGAAGTGAVLATRGEEVRLGPGAAVTTRLTAPVTVRVRL